MLEKNKDITKLSNFKTPAKAKYFYNFNGNIEEFIKILKEYKNEKKLFVGGGTNMLFAFDFYDGLVIKLSDYSIGTDYIFENYKGLRGNTLNTKFKYKDGLLEVSAFEKISDISEILYRENINKLWERFIGLPGTIGGAVFGNAGCFGLETENNFVKAEVLNLKTLEIEIIDKKKANFSYRNSIFKEKGNYVILKVYFNLSKKVEKYAFDKDLDFILNFRTNVQPSGNTCGSFFKNPSREFPAGMLIEKVGLKGKNINGAFFSSKHANFLMNDGTATYKDLLNLKKIAQKKVKEQFGLELIEEVRIIEN